MVSYLFSIRPEKFEEISPLLKSIAMIRKTREATDNFEEGTRLIRQEQKIMDEVEKILINAKEKRIKLHSIEGVLDEGDIVLCFERFFRKIDPSMTHTVRNTTKPAMIKEYWAKLSLHLEKKGDRMDAIKYCENEEDEDGRKSDTGMISRLYDNWSSFIKYTAKNGNWYYHMIIM